MATKPEQTLESVVSLAKRRGFVFQGSEIYGGLAGTWDYGPLGVTLKKNIENIWWKMFVTDREDMYGIDAAIIMNPSAWIASGHVDGFSDPLVECQNKNCKNKRHRVDHLFSTEDYNRIVKKINTPEIKEPFVKKLSEEISSVMPEDSQPDFDGQDIYLTRNAVDKSINQFENKVGPIMQTALMEHGIKCPGCGEINWGVPKQFNMMFKTFVGASEDASNVAYLRPETAGGMFVNYKNILDSLHPKLPFGLAQIGKAFRNEIAPRDFIFRVRELEQMEIEYFIRPENWESEFENWRQRVWSFVDAIGLTKGKVHELEVTPEDRAHYSKRTIDFEFDYPFGRKELYGLAYRTDFDLKSHQNMSTVDLSYFDEESKTRFLPHVIEPSFGVGRTMLAVLTDAYTEDELGGEKRVYLKLSKAVAPVRVAVFPLLKNKPELVVKARELYLNIKKVIPNAMFDDNGNIGKRYRRQDEIGTPHCVTIDFETLEGKGVTVRNRDTGEQERVGETDLISYLTK